MRAWKFIEKNFEKWFLIISLVAMVLIIFMQVVLRWFHAATVWADEHPSGAEADPGHERRPPRGDQGGGSLIC